jgi:hypothetical protein
LYLSSCQGDNDFRCEGCSDTYEKNVISVKTFNYQKSLIIFPCQREGSGSSFSKEGYLPAGRGEVYDS